MREIEIRQIISDAYVTIPPKYVAANILLKEKYSQQEVINACKRSELPEPQWNEVLNAMRDLELGLNIKRT